MADTSTVQPSGTPKGVTLIQQLTGTQDSEQVIAAKQSPHERCWTACEPNRVRAPSDGSFARHVGATIRKPPVLNLQCLNLQWVITHPTSRHNVGLRNCSDDTDYCTISQRNYALHFVRRRIAVSSTEPPDPPLVRDDQNTSIVNSSYPEVASRIL